MNKFTIPAILLSTVMVAGMFAFMPVEQASTTHTSATGILESTMTPFKVACAEVTIAGGSEDGEITLDVNGANPVIVKAIYFESGTGSGAVTDADDIIILDDIRVDTVTLGTSTDNSVGDGSIRFDAVPTEGELLTLVDFDKDMENSPLYATTDIGVTVNGAFTGSTSTYTLSFAGYQVSGDTAPTCDITGLS